MRGSKDKFSINPNCTNCPLHTSATTVAMRGDGPDDAQIILIGEAPNAKEDKRGTPFLGEPGDIIRGLLERNDLTEVTYLTNIVKCVPPDNHKPTPAEIKACRPYLDAEIERINPEFVVSVGVPATKALFKGKAKINAVHGEVIENDKVSYLGMPIFHPSYTLRDPTKLPGLKNDIERLGRLLNDELRNDTVYWNVVRKGNLDVFLQEFSDASEFAFDCETSGLFTFDPNGYITAVAIALPERTWVIPGFMHPDYQQYSHSPFAHGDALKQLMQILFAIAKRDRKEIFAQNGKFDNKWLRNQFGGGFYLAFDTMLAHHILDENVNHDLTSMCRTYLDEPEYDIPLDEKIGKSKKPVINYKYCAQDATYTLRLTHIFKKMIKKDPSLHRLFYRLTMQGARAMEDIEMEGITVDPDKFHAANWDLLSQRVTLEHELNALAGYKLNWSSPAQVGKLLFDELGLKSTVLTKTGAPSTSMEALIDLAFIHEIPDKLVKFRQVVKFRSTYLKGWESRIIDNQLYLDYKLHGTVTGRYSSPLHPIPRDNQIRSMITAPPGWTFAVADISQAELRIAAHLSRDVEMKKCFSEGTDVHWRTLMEMMRLGEMGEFADGVIRTANGLVTEEDLKRGELYWDDAVDILLRAGPGPCVDIWKHWKEGRYRSKQINFGFVFGMWEKTFIRTAKREMGWEPTFAEARQAREAYFNLYYGLKPWHEKQRKLVKNNGSVRTLSGRLRRLPGIYSHDWGIKSEAERQAINSPVQGFIGDYKVMCLIEIHQGFDRSKLRVCGEHHDAVLMTIKDGYHDECAPKILKILSQPALLKEFKINLSVPMLGEVELGNWGIGKEWHP